VDNGGRIVVGNALMRRLNGPVLQSMTTAPIGEWVAYDADGNRLEPQDFPVRRALRLGETTLPGIDFLFRDVDGHETWYRVGGVPLRWEGGRVQEALAILRDIDAEKRLLAIQQQINAALEQRVREEMAAREAAQKRAAHAERMHALGQIAGGIAHDFNNVLQAVLGGAVLIERRPEDAERVLRNARLVLDAARRGASITSRLLAFARRGDLRAENIDAAALLTDMAEVLTHTLGGSILCRTHVPSGLPPLFADRGQLETVLVNLATNARDAMPSGGTLTLEADTEIVSAGLPHPAGLAQGGYVRILVTDTGTGMDRAVLARVTEPFFTTKEPGKGTGLGLAMAKGFAEQSGGSLSIDSVVGRGTRIILWLPNGRSAPGFVPDTAEAARADKPCVLLVDDDAIVRDVLTLSLQDAGYCVRGASSGAAALIRLDARERVDIIVTDLTMPSMDGLTLIRSAQERLPGLPAVLLTGFAADGAALAMGGAISGAFSLLRKPVSGNQLIDRIRSLLEARTQASSV
jgi:signal transduction histidine kinase/CheY-like chemotaxis protein